jgi:hypothetical protein
MKAILYYTGFLLFTPRFNFFDLISILTITTVAQLYSLWILLLIVPLIVFSVAMEWRVEKEKQDAQADNGTIG